MPDDDQQRTDPTDAAPATSPAVQAAPAGPEVTVYWRPGCPFCTTLRAGLHLRGVRYESVNIWHDPEAAAFVRSVANGNETVPTVTVGTVSLVNPSAKRVAELVSAG